MASTNLYLLLGIYDPKNDLVGSSDDDPAVMSVIGTALQNKRREWSNDKLKNPRKASKASNNLEKTNDALRDLGTMSSRRAAWADARSTVDQQVRTLLGVFISAHPGTLLEGEITKVCEGVFKNLGVTVDDATVRALIPDGVTVGQSGGPGGRDLKKPAAYARFHNAETMLSTYDYISLYDLLGSRRNVDKIKATPTSQWKQWADEDKKALPTKATTEVADHKKLYELAATAFKDDAARAQYDEYLAYEALTGVLSEARQACSVSKRLETSVGEQYIRRMLEIASKNSMTLTHDDAVDYLTAMCAKAGIMYAAPDRGASSAAAQLEFCPWCGAIVSRGAAACSACGGRIMMVCPGCGAMNRADVRHCSQCSFDYGNLQRASSMLDEARAMLGALRFDEAATLCDEAGHLWKTLPGIDGIRKDITRQRQQVSPIAGQLADAVNAREFIKARRIYESIQARYPQFSNEELHEQIESGIAAAGAVMKQPGAARNIATVLRAWEACADYPGLAQALAANPPQAVPGLTVRADSIRHANVISWQASPTRGAAYVLIRKEGSRPLNAGDGVEITRTAGISFVDTTIKPAVEYHYALVVALGPLTSGMVCAGPVVNCFDVANVRVIASESSIQISWSGLPRDAKVEAWRAEGHDPARFGDGVQVTNVVNGGLLDTGLTSGREYHYTIWAVYPGYRGGRVRSRGVHCSGVPSAPPEPIGFILPQLLPGGGFSMEWDQPQQGESRFLYTTEAPQVAEGDLLSEQELASRGMPLAVTVTGNGRGTFTLPDDSIYHIISATVKDGMALIGTIATVSSRKTVNIDKIVATGADACVMFTWPQGSDNVLLMWRTDRFPQSPEDGGAARMLVNRKKYELNKGIVVKGLSLGITYYFSLFAQLGTGDSASYSAGSTATFAFSRAGKVTYHIAAKMFLGKVRSARLIIESTCAVPASELRVQKSGVPVFQTQGVPVLNVPALPGAGIHEIEVPVAALGREIYYKLFFKNRDDYNRIDLTTSPGTIPEIGK